MIKYNQTASPYGFLQIETLPRRATGCVCLAAQVGGRIDIPMSFSALTCSSEDDTGFVWDLVRGGVQEVNPREPTHFVARPAIDRGGLLD